jgi:uncharacterized membrane protein YtjA (UPF0391 family)
MAQAATSAGLAYGGGAGSRSAQIMQAVFHVFLVLFFVSLLGGSGSVQPPRTKHTRDPFTVGVFPA